MGNQKNIFSENNIPKKHGFTEKNSEWFSQKKNEFNSKPTESEVNEKNVSLIDNMLEKSN